MKYFFLLAFLLQQLSAFAQVDTLQGKTGLEGYLKRQYHYKAIEISAVNSIIRDTNAVQAAQPKYWLKADFNHDGKPDLVVAASITKGKLGERNALFVLTSEGKHYTKVDIINPTYKFGSSGPTAYSIYTVAGLDYLVMTSLVTTFVGMREARNGHFFNYRVAHDTLFVQQRKPMIYSRRPCKQVIESVTFSMTECFGTCPVFQLDIDKEGAVSYKGIRYVDRMGDFKLLMSKTDLAYLTALLAAINPLRLSDHYAVDYTDAPTVYLTVRYATGQTKAIEDYGEHGTYGLELVYHFLAEQRNF